MASKKEAADSQGTFRVHQVLTQLGYGDAIGHEVLGIQQILRSSGFESDIFVESADYRLKPLTRNCFELPTACDSESLIIHHFSIGSKASRIAFALPSRMILIYHNITPPHYFSGLIEGPEIKSVAWQCYTGRRELSAYRSRCHLALGDSSFNRQELVELGFPRTDVLPPVLPNLPHLNVRTESALTSSFDDDFTNILFVGRIIPHKRIEDLIRIFGAYHHMHNSRSRLVIVGSHVGFQNYRATLHDLAARLHLPEVHFVGQVTDAELVSFYEIADVYLSASEHEGFCVPLIEAFHHQIPVLAYAATAVPSTMDGGGLLYDTKNPIIVASLLNEVVSDSSLHEKVLRSQDEALTRLEAKDFVGTLLNFVKQVRQAPPLPEASIREGFWQQFERYEQIEKLKHDYPLTDRVRPTGLTSSRRLESIRPENTTFNKLMSWIRTR